jgi:pectinesterase
MEPHEMNRKRRRTLGLGAAAPLLTHAFLLNGCASSAAIPAAISAVVDERYAGPSGAVRQGAGQYTTVQQALDAAPNASATPWRILLRAGRYYEKLYVRKANILLIGDSRSASIITYDAYAGQAKPAAYGSGNWTTAGCASLTVSAPGFCVENVTIENGYDYLANDGKLATDPTRTNDPQAVALMLTHGSDRACFKNVTLTGHQDTLFVDAGRSYFRDCAISGGVDFIFGAGQAVFEACDIVSRPRTKPNVNPFGYVTAPSTQITERFGLVFLRCKLLRENASVPVHSTALGRPWHPAVNRPDGRYADPDAVGSSVFIECFMDYHITNEGWHSMTGQQKSGPDRTVFYPQDARFFEYKSIGPGAKINPQRRQLTDAQAADYMIAKVLPDWRPQCM